jgi:outer membrane protein OmpA-like peptidoglycan-associated protein
MTQTQRRVFASLAALGLLAGCSGTTLDREVGAGLGPDIFGVATANNVGVQTGQIQYVNTLGTRFATEVPTTINFAFNSATLDAEARAILAQQANFIRQFPEVRFSVYGHTDLVGSDAYNRSLGLRRARAVVDFMVQNGVGRDRLDALVSEGETQPVIPVPGPERANRRTVTEVSGFMQRHPQVLNGQYAAIIYREYVASGARPLEPISSMSGSVGE